MNREKYQELVATFFEWDQPAISQIFSELLSAVAAEDTCSMASLMSQNYETARALTYNT